MLIAEDLLLLLTAEDSGKLAASSTHADVALGGALLVELALMERVDIAAPEERVREGRLVVKDAGPTGDSVLDEALAALAQKEGKKPQSVVAALGKGKRVLLYERLAAGGLLRPEDRRILGIFPSHRWPAEGRRPRGGGPAGLVVAALRQGGTTDARTGALVSLLLALDVVDKVVGPESVGLSRRELNASAKRIAEQDWAATAVRSAIDSINAAIIAATSSAVVLGGGAGGP